MGTVYRAAGTKLNRAVAIKFLLSSELADASESTHLHASPAGAMGVPLSEVRGLFRPRPACVEQMPAGGAETERLQQLL